MRYSIEHLDSGLYYNAGEWSEEPQYFDEAEATRILRAQDGPSPLALRRDPTDMSLLDAALLAPDYSHSRWLNQSRDAVCVYRHEPGFGPSLIGIFSDCADALTAHNVIPDPPRDR